MRVGIIVPQGWTQEYVGVEPRQAWQRTRSVARRADELGFESIWLFDHFHTVPTTVETTTFELFTTLSALATATRRVRLGQLVTCAGYRNPALLAKMISTLDVISDGRVELGLGAGWKGDEWDAYGYGFPSLRIRQDMLQDALAIVTLMWAAGRATYTGDDARVSGAVNEPKPLQVAHPPIVVGGNGRQRTWRLAARYADELNLDAVPPEAMADAMAVIRSSCEEIDRDPNSLRVSVHIWWEHLDGAPSRAALLDACRKADVARVMTLVRDAAHDPCSRPIPGGLRGGRDRIRPGATDLAGILIRASGRHERDHPIWRSDSGPVGRAVVFVSQPTPLHEGIRLGCRAREPRSGAIRPNQRTGSGRQAADRLASAMRSAAARA